MYQLDETSQTIKQPKGFKKILKREKPKLSRKKMIEECEKGEVDIVLCKTQSRFSRDMEVIERYIHNKFIEWGILMS